MFIVHNYNQKPEVINAISGKRYMSYLQARKAALKIKNEMGMEWFKGTFPYGIAVSELSGKMVISTGLVSE